MKDSEQEPVNRVFSHFSANDVRIMQQNSYEVPFDFVEKHFLLKVERFVYKRLFVFEK